MSDTPFADHAASLRNRGLYIPALLVEQHSGEARFFWNALERCGLGKNRVPSMKFDHITGSVKHWEIADRKGDQIGDGGFCE